MTTEEILKVEAASSVHELRYAVAAALKALSKEAQLEEKITDLESRVKDLEAV